MSNRFLEAFRSKPAAAADRNVIAARDFVYQLFVATKGTLGACHSLHPFVGERERGWVVTREPGGGKERLLSVFLTSNGHLVARRGIRRVHNGAA